MKTGQANGGIVNVEEKIEILRRMINGDVPPEDYPYEFQGKSLAALQGDLANYEMILQATENLGGAGKKEADSKRDAAAHAAGHIQLKLQEAMAMHHGFVEEGIQGRERLESFAALLENDAYWEFLQENETERIRVREQHFNGMMDAIDQGERSVLNMSDREMLLQGEANMHRLRDREIETKGAEVSSELQTEYRNALSASLESHMAHLNFATPESLEDRLQASEKADQASVALHAKERSTAESRSPQNSAGIEEALAAISELDSLEIPEEVKRLAEETPAPFRTFAANVGSYDPGSQEKPKLEEIREELAGISLGGVEESGSNEPGPAPGQSPGLPNEQSITLG